MRRSPNYCPGIGSHWLAHEADDETKGYQSLRNEFGSAQWTETVVSSATTKGGYAILQHGSATMSKRTPKRQSVHERRAGRFSTGGRRDGTHWWTSGNEGENKQHTAGKARLLTGLPHTAHVRTRGV
ncbi:hypothetical protein VCV18_010559 [Metarhizium anisopliae]